jgi:predicted PurR-regulated permease PerM
MERPQRVEIVIGVRTVLMLLGVGFLVVLAVVSLGTLLSIFVAAVIALGLDPPVGALVRRGWGRGRAALAVFAALFASVFVLVLVTAGPLWDQIVEFINELPAFWDELTEKPVFQDLVSSADADEKVRNALKELAEGLPDAASALLGIAGGVFGTFLSLVTLTFLALFLLMERPTITTWLFGFAPPAVERRWAPVVEESVSAVSQSLLGNVAISLVAGTFAGVSAWALGLPFPIVLAVIAGLLDLIPQVGATIASIILVAVALTESTTAAVIMLVLQLIYQQVENYIIYPIVYRQAVELSPFTTIVAVLIAGSILGVVGAILAVPFAAVIKIVTREAGAPRRARMAALRAPVGPDSPEITRSG